MKCVLFHPLIFAVLSGSTTTPTTTATATTIITTMRNFSVGVWQYMPHCHIRTPYKMRSRRHRETERERDSVQKKWMGRIWFDVHTHREAYASPTEDEHGSTPSELVVWKNCAFRTSQWQYAHAFWAQAPLIQHIAHRHFQSKSTVLQISTDLLGCWMAILMQTHQWSVG